jgi:peptide/nickel transport system substrate-binding protein
MSRQSWRAPLFRAAFFCAGLMATAPAAPANAQDLKIGLAAEPSAMDPHYHNLTPNNGLLGNLFDRLVEFDEKDALVPALAESWKAINDKTWEFKLRKNVKWHDGTAFTADDVVFTFERAPNVPNSPSSFASSIKGKTIEKVDDHTIQLSTASPHPLMPHDLQSIMIVSKKTGEGAKTEDYNSGKAAVGTGPFKFGTFVPGDRIEMVRNEQYWGAKSPWARAIFKPIKSGPSRVAALLAGDVDIIEDVPTPDVERLKKDAKVSIAQATSRRVVYFHMDQFRDETPFITAKDGSKIKNPLKDLKVRQALSKAINRDAIVSRVMEGVAIPAGQLMAEQFAGVSKNLKPTAYDPEGAKRLLAEAGFPNGFKMTIHGPNGRYVNDVKIAEAAAQMFTRIGVETAIEMLPPATFFTRASAGAAGQPEFSFILVGWSADTGENSSAIKPLLGTFDKDKGTGTANRGRYSNPAVDKLIVDALATVDDAKRNALLADATDLAIADVGLIPSHFQITTWATRKGVKILARPSEYTVVSGVTKE